MININRSMDIAGFAMLKSLNWKCDSIEFRRMLKAYKKLGNYFHDEKLIEKYASVIEFIDNVKAGEHSEEEEKVVREHLLGLIFIFMAKNEPKRDTLYLELLDGIK